MKVLPYIEVAGVRYDSFPDQETREQVRELDGVLNGSGETTVTHKEELPSNIDPVNGLNTIDLSGVATGTELNVSTGADKAMVFSSVNWFHTKELTVDESVDIVLPFPLPAGFYAVSANLESRTGEYNPAFVFCDAEGNNIGKTITGVANYHAEISNTAYGGRHGARLEVTAPVHKIVVNASNYNTAGATAVMTEISLWYSPTAHPASKETYYYKDDYDALVYDLAGGSVPIVTAAEQKMILSDFGEFYVTYEVEEVLDGTQSMVQLVASLKAQVASLSAQVGQLSTGTVPIYKDSPDYDYTSLNLDDGWSDFTFVGNDLWVFKASDHEDHDNINGVLTICNLSNGTKKTIAHNLGHCNTVHYNPKNEKLLVSNMPEKPYSLYIFDNVDSWSTKSTVNLKSEPHVTINVSDIGDAQGTVACWGDENNGQHNIVYVNGGYNNNWWKILLGTGTNDLGKGDYEAADAGVYNGSYQVLQSWNFVSPYNNAEREVTQGIDFYKGRIHTSNGHHELQWWEWDFSDSFVSRREHNITLYKANGSVNPTLSEGFAIHDGYAYVGCIFAYIGSDGRYGLTDTNGFIKVKL